MRTNEDGLTLIRRFEGCKLKAYQDTGGVWTIGVGHAGRDVKPNSVITEDIAERMFLQDVAVAEGGVNRWVRVPLNENQFSALVSFVFNLGSSKLGGSTLLKFLNRNEIINAACEFPKWRFADGKPLKGLTDRREAEKALFLKPVLTGGKDFA